MNSEAKVGATAIFGLALLVAMILYLSGLNFGTGTYKLSAVFSHVNGLREGNTVSYAGVYIGTVRSVNILPEGIMVEMLIDSKIKIPQNSKFAIASSGLLGEQYINVIPDTVSLANKKYILPDDVLQGESPYDVNELMKVTAETMQEIKEAVSSINDILGDEKVQASMKEISFNINNLTSSLSKLAEDNREKINETVDNLALMSESLKDLVERLDSMARIVDNNGDTAVNLRELIANLNTTSRRIENMAASLESVVADPKTAQELKEIIANTQDITEKASAITTKTSLNTAIDLEMLYDFKNDTYRGNTYLKVGRDSSQSFALIGVTGIGDDNLFNLQYGRDVTHWTERMGIIDGKIGLGADVVLGRDWKVSLDIYDPNSVKYKLRAKYQLTPDVSVIGQSDRDKDRQDSWHNYLGVQRTF